MIKNSHDEVAIVLKIINTTNFTRNDKGITVVLNALLIGIATSVTALTTLSLVQFSRHRQESLLGSSVALKCTIVKHKLRITNT